MTVIDGFTTAQTDHAGITTAQTRAFTATGMTLTQTDGRGNTTTLHTDIAGRTISVTDAAGNTTTTAYSPCCDNPATVTDALGNTTCYGYDIRGRKTAEWGTAIQPALFAYDEANRMVNLTTFRADAGDITTDPSERTDGDTTTWQYHDATGLLVKKTYADGTYEDTAYNVLNLKATLTDPRGTVTTCTYETARGLLMGETYSDATPARSYAYNHLGLTTQIVDGSGTRTLAYTAYNEPESESLAGDGKTHLVTELRDSYGRSTGYTYAKAGSIQQTTSIGYGTDGRITTAGFLYGGASKTFTYGYLENSHLPESLSMPNNMTLTRAYEEKRDLVTAMTYKRTTTTVVNRGYTYDALACPVTRTTARKGATRNDAFTYNSRSELATATLGTDGYGYGYDNIGNRKTAQELAQALTYASNNLNQYSSITRSTLNSSPSTLEEPFVPTYDANGNQTLVKTATGIWTVQYDANNRPVSFTKTEGENTNVVECGYDSMGRRYMKKVTVNGTVTLHHRYIYRGYLQVACCDLTRSAHPCLWLITWDPAEPVASRPLAIQKDGTWYCYGLDITKNVWELFSSSGYIRTTYDYTPYGGVTEEGDVAQPVQWSSEMYDAELAMVYYNYRHYNPMDGRWISRDPIAEDGGWNLYVFVKNSCWVMDRLGRYPATLDKGILPRPDDYRNNPNFANVRFNNGRRMTIYGITKTTKVPTIGELYIERADIKCILIKDDLLPQHPRIDVTYFYDRNYNPQDPSSGYRDRQGRNVIEHENVYVSIEIEEWNSLIGKLEESRSKVFRTEEETRTAYRDLIEKRQDYKLTTTQRHAAHDTASGSPQH